MREPAGPARPAAAAAAAASGATTAPASGRQTGPITAPQPRPGRPVPGRGPRPGYPSGPTRGPRRARLIVKRVDPWSVLKFSFVFSVAILLVWIVVVGLLYGVLHSAGVFDKINSVLADFTTKNGVAQWQLNLTSSRVIGWAAVIGGVNAVLFTALATLGAFVYNLCGSLSGGIEVTLTERD